MTQLARIPFMQQAFLALALSSWTGASLLHAETYYVDVANGDDTRNSVQAREPATPWQTLERAATDQHVLDGDTIIVKPGTYTQTLKPRDNNMTWRADPLWGAVLSPATDEAVKVDGRSGIIIDGFLIQGGTTGIRYENTTGGTVRNNVVQGASFQGIAIIDSYNITVEDNRVLSNGVSPGGGSGIKGVRGANLAIRNNLVYANSDQGISLEQQGSTSLNNVIESNTVDSNTKGGVRLMSPVGQTRVVNNIITRNGAAIGGVGLKIPDNCCPTLVTEDYNNSWGNGNGPSYEFDLPSGTRPGSQDTNLDPLYIDPDGLDNLPGGAGWMDDRYYLSQMATGQPQNSPCVDTGDPAALVDGTTATDNFLDEGAPDRGFHYAAQTLPMQQLTLTKAKTAFWKEGEQFLASCKLWGNFALGAGSNGIDPATERIRIDLDTFTQTLPGGSCTAKNQGQVWSCKSPAPGVTSFTLDLRKNSFTLETNSIPTLSTPLPASTRFNLHIGDDMGATEQSYTEGSVKFP